MYILIFFTSNQVNSDQWFQNKFKEHFLDIVAYSILARAEVDYFSKWIFSVSSNGVSWTETNTQSNKDTRIGIVFLFPLILLFDS